jgi:hypothetical protein
MDKENISSARIYMAIKEFKYIIEQLEQYNDEIFGTITQCDRKTQDILHEIEFHKFNACGGYTLAKRIKETREIRRSARNEKEIIQYFKKFSDENKNLTIKLSNILCSMKQMKKRQEDRVYTPKIQEELSVAL